ncbi:MAG: DUF5668 domain-containing protein [Anaerolineae bacterium]
MDERRPRRIDILGPVLLIAIGVILLLNTLGVLEWAVWWRLIRLWPVLLIAAGLDLLLGRRSAWGSLLAAVLVLAVIGGAVWLSVDGSLEAQGLETRQVRQALDGATQAEVLIDPGVGVLRLEALPEAADLIQGTIRLTADEEIAEEATTSGQRIRYELDSLKESWTVPLGGWNSQRIWDLGLTPGAALDLEAHLGAGEAVLDLSGLDLSDLQVNVGVGRVEITLPAEGQFEALVEEGVGQLVILVPRGMELHIEGDLGLVVRDVPAGYEQGDDTITSPGYAAAANRVEITVDQGIGQLEIRPAP